MSNEELIAEIRDTMKRQEWLPASLGIRAADALEAQSAPPPQTVQDALDLLDAIHGDAAIQYHAYASLHDAISRIEPQSAPLVADSREALARWFAERRGHIVPRSGDVLNADALLASGVVSLAADRDRAVAEATWYEGNGVGHSDALRGTITPNPYRESEGQ